MDSVVVCVQTGVWQVVFKSEVLNEIFIFSKIGLFNFRISVCLLVYLHALSLLPLITVELNFKFPQPWFLPVSHLFYHIYPPNFQNLRLMQNLSSPHHKKTWENLLDNTRNMCQI